MYQSNAHNHWLYVNQYWITQIINAECHYITCPPSLSLDWFSHHIIVAIVLGHTYAWDLEIALLLFLLWACLTWDIIYLNLVNLSIRTHILIKFNIRLFLFMQIIRGNSIAMFVQHSSELTLSIDIRSNSVSAGYLTCRFRRQSIWPELISIEYRRLDVSSSQVI